ncbi:MAG: hypothetical protein ABEN55_03600 [Bradymonadaceae bacterium]
MAISILNLAQVDLMGEDFEKAGARLDEAERRFTAIGPMGGRRHSVRTARLVWAAGTDSWTTLDELWEPLADGWPDGADLLRDYPWLLEMAGDYAADAGQRERAERLWRLAGDLWEQLDADGATERIADKLEN